MNTIPVYIASDALSFERCLSLKQFTLSTDWKGDQTRESIEFLMAADPMRLFFLANMEYGPEKPLLSAPTAPSSNFVEGLWNYDLAEFFLCSDSSGYYQEFNLAPNGDWWSALFSSYRKRSTDTDCNMIGTETFSKIDGSVASFGISLLRSELKVDITFENISRLNVTAIVKSPVQVFLSYAPMPGAEADFHKTEHFCQREAVIIS